MNKRIIDLNNVVEMEKQSIDSIRSTLKTISSDILVLLDEIKVLNKQIAYMEQNMDRVLKDIKNSHNKSITEYSETILKPLEYRMKQGYMDVIKGKENENMYLRTEIHNYETNRGKRMCDPVGRMSLKVIDADKQHRAFMHKRKKQLKKCKEKLIAENKNNNKLSEAQFKKNVQRINRITFLLIQ